jgi:hypothetical protein
MARTGAGSLYERGRRASRGGLVEEPPAASPPVAEGAKPPSVCGGFVAATTGCQRRGMSRLGNTLTWRCPYSLIPVRALRVGI